MPNNLQLGRLGESIALHYLTKQSFQIIDRNWRYKNHHEIDLVAWSPEKDLVAIEVRFHEKPQTYQPFESITKAKVHRLKQALQMYVNLCLQHTPPMRIDVVSVVEGHNKIEHFESVNLYY